MHEFRSAFEICASRLFVAGDRLFLQFMAYLFAGNGLLVAACPVFAKYRHLVAVGRRVPSNRPPRAVRAFGGSRAAARRVPTAGKNESAFSKTTWDYTVISPAMLQFMRRVSSSPL